MNFPKSKYEITIAIVNELKHDPDNIWKDISIDKLMYKWWKTGRTGSGLRLTEEGRDAFSRANIEKYDFPYKIISIEAYQFLVSSLNKKLKCPYYLGNNTLDTKSIQLYISIYDQKIGVLISLFGSIQEYLKSIDREV